jgi:hypothetical protein
MARQEGEEGREGVKEDAGLFLVVRQHAIDSVFKLPATRLIRGIKGFYWGA